MHTKSLSRRPYVVLAAVCSVLLGLLTVYALRVRQSEWEVNLVRALQGADVPGLEPLSRALAILGYGVAWVAIVALLATVILLRGGLRLTVLLIVTSLLQDVGSGIKMLVDRSRPPASLVDVWYPFGSPSFPSGHVLGATLVFGFLFFAIDHLTLSPRVRLAVRCFSVAWVLMMGVGRVQVGAHWPTDVLAAYLTGALLLLPIVVYLRHHHPRVASPVAA